MRSRRILLPLLFGASLAAVPLGVLRAGEPAKSPTPAGSATPATAPPPADSGKKAPRIRARIAIVDVERCIADTEDGLRARALLQKFSDRRKMAIAQLEAKLKGQQDEIADLAKSTGPSEKLREMALKYQRELQVYNDTIKKMNQEISAREEELYGPIEKKIKAIFKRIGEAEGYDVIIDRKAMPVTKPDLDLTERVVREYNWGK